MTISFDMNLFHKFKDVDKELVSIYDTCGIKQDIDLTKQEFEKCIVITEFLDAVDFFGAIKYTDYGDLVRQTKIAKGSGGDAYELSSFRICKTRFAFSYSPKVELSLSHYVYSNGHRKEMFFHPIASQKAFISREWFNDGMAAKVFSTFGDIDFQAIEIEILNGSLDKIPPKEQMRECINYNEKAFNFKLDDDEFREEDLSALKSFTNTAESILAEGGQFNEQENNKVWSRYRETKN